MSNLLRRSALLAFSLAALASTVAAQNSNVLLIVADDLGVDHVGAYAEGSSIAPTPNIDALAQRGVLFRNAWASPSCSPTRACLHTGRYGFRTGIGAPGRTAILPAEELTLPERLDLAGSGRSHALLGKWHLGGGNTGPNDAGWSHYAGFINGVIPDYFAWTRVVNGQSAQSTTYQTTQTTDDAIQWIQTQAGPWVCMVSYAAPHTPFHAPPASLHTRNLPGGAPTQNRVLFYQAAIEAMDTEIGRLLTSLGPTLQSTDVFFLGDNGTPGNVSIAPFVRTHGKGSPYEGGVNVPLIAAGPSITSPGREVAGLVHAVDLQAAILELAGVDASQGFAATDGVSLTPYLQSAAAAAQRTIVYADSFTGTNPAQNGFACARDVTFKLIRNFSPQGAVTEELYNLATDSFETNNLLSGALSPAAQASYAALAAHIDSLRDRNGSFTTFGSTQCVGSNGAPNISSPDVPTTGASYRVDLQNGPASAPVVLFVGDSSTSWLGLPLPFDLAVLGGGSGCAVHSSNDIQLSRATDPLGNAAVTIGIPNMPTLVGGAVYHSWLCIDLAAPGNSLGVTASSGARAKIGG